MILYFTGTGNSRWIAEQLAVATYDTILNITDCIKQHELLESVVNTPILGIVFPVHSWAAPHLVLDFLSHLSLSSCQYRYAVCTCGDDVGKGMDGLNKVFALDAAWSVAMPNTYIPMFNLDTDKLSHEKISHARHIIPQIAADILQREKVWEVHEGGTPWLKTYLLNPLFKHFFISSKGFHLDEGCVSCGICRTSCPVENIQLIHGSPVWGEQCIHCMACIHACPQKVIQFKNSTRKKGRYHLSDYLGR